MTEVQTQDLTRTHAQAALNRNGRRAFLDPGAHDLGHTDSAQQERQQRDEPQVTLDVFERAPHARLGLAVRLNTHAPPFANCLAETTLDRGELRGTLFGR
jgi:hypothetical protein